MNAYFIWRSLNKDILQLPILCYSGVMKSVLAKALGTITILNTEMM